MAGKKPDSLDVEVGRKVRALRLEKDFSPEKLGEALGLAFQQVQGHENGSNRISAARLRRIAEILGVPTSTFLAHTYSPPAPADDLCGLADTGAALRLLRAYSRIPSVSVQQALTTLAEELAAGSPPAGHDDCTI
jgi:transcriptional regulator with XRE-family HTH domain